MEQTVVLEPVVLASSVFQVLLKVTQGESKILSFFLILIGKQRRQGEFKIALIVLAKSSSARPRVASHHPAFTSALSTQSLSQCLCSCPAKIRLDEDVLKTFFVFIFRRRFCQDQYIRLGYTSSRRLQDVFKTFSRRLQEVLPRHLQGVLQKRLQDIFKTF